MASLTKYEKWPSKKERSFRERKELPAVMIVKIKQLVNSTENSLIEDQIPIIRTLIVLAGMSPTNCQQTRVGRFLITQLAKMEMRISVTAAFQILVLKT